MNARFALARGLDAGSTWALKHVFRRPAANFPGKLGLVVDPGLIADLRPRIRTGSVVVVGTNGKTTVTNLLADALEASSATVACNRTGANLDSGVATALLHTVQADWGVFESDELWLAKVLPQLQPEYVVLLNLFRDQLDRMGEIDHIQASIAQALATSPATTLLYNADDPFCQSITDSVDNRVVPFGLNEDLGLAQNTVADASMCQRCDSILDYEWRQYGQLGAFSCPNCGFRREPPAYAAHGIELSGTKATFTLRSSTGDTQVSMPFSSTYMLYNVLAVYAAADCCKVPRSCIDQAIRSFAPSNGRLQHYEIGGRRILLNLAKNPTGFNQNLRIAARQPGPKAVAFFINDKEADGHDVSWLWDVDFQELAGMDGLVAFAGGIRRNDMQVRLKYAGIDAQLVDGARDFLAKASAASPDASLFLIANYTALPGVKAELDALVDGEEKACCYMNGVRRDSSLTLGMTATGRVCGCAAIAGRASRRAIVGRACERACGCAVDAERARGRASARRKLRETAGACRCEPGREPRGAEEAYRCEAGREPQGAEEACCCESELRPRGAGKLTIVHLYPELLNLYGDGGNVAVLAERARRRGVAVDIVRISPGETADLERADIVFLGGGPDREQHLASIDLLEQADALRAYVEDDGVLLAICGGYQILGREWLLGDESVPGLGIVDITTKRAEGGSHNRLVGNIALRSPLASMPVIGYENHAGRTYLGTGCQPFGHVAGKHGRGNNDRDKADGILYRNVVGTYLHGPLLAKNPEVADSLIRRALTRRARREGRPAAALPPFDDAAERAANAFMCARLGVSG